MTLTVQTRRTSKVDNASYKVGENPTEYEEDSVAVDGASEGLDHIYRKLDFHIIPALWCMY